MPEDDKLKKANLAIKKINEDEENKEAEKLAEIESVKSEVGPNVADAAIAKAQEEFDLQQENRRAASKEMALAK